MSYRARFLALALLTGLFTTACGERFVTGTPSAAPAPPAAAATSAPATTVPPLPSLPVALPTYPVPVASARDDSQPVLEVVDQGFSAYAVQYTGNVTSWAVKLRNPNTDTWSATSATLRATFTDASGAVVLVEEGPVFGDVGPGQVVAFGSTDSSAKATGIATSMQVDVLDTRWNDFPRAPGDITMGPATARPAPASSLDTSAQVLVDCTASSSFLSKIAGMSVTMVYLDASGRIIGGSQQNSDLDGETLSVPGGGTAEFTLKGWFSPPAGVPAVECSANYLRPL
jgi:hypothetical protein